jgi:hypothetical protein
MSGAMKIFERAIVRPSFGMSTDLAEHVLSLDFPPEDHVRYSELNEKAELGTLSKEEEVELDDYLDANDLLAILQAKARATLKRHSPAA